jgi:MOSC domain-containing protein YiiM
MKRLVSINTGQAQLLLIRDTNEPVHGVQTAIRKTSVSSLEHPAPIELQKLGLEGDEQVDLSVHGGLDKAVYAFCSEHYAQWKTWLVSVSGAADRLDHFGAFGENLTVEGFDEETVFVGDVWRIGQTILRVTEPRSPCFKFTALMKAPLAVRHMFETGQSGWYLQVVQAGPIQAGSLIAVEPGPREMSIAKALGLKKRAKNL